MTQSTTTTANTNNNNGGQGVRRTAWEYHREISITLADRGMRKGGRLDRAAFRHFLRYASCGMGWLLYASVCGLVLAIRRTTCMHRIARGLTQ